jgi:cell division protein FtsB
MKNRIKKIMAFLPRPLRNKYLLTGALFLVWILLFDPVNLIDWMQEQHKLRHLRREQRQLEQRINNVADKIKSFSNPDSLEKIAREQFYFVGPGEEVFLVESD